MASANVLTLAGLLAQAAEPTVPGAPGKGPHASSSLSAELRSKTYGLVMQTDRIGFPNASACWVSAPRAAQQFAASCLTYCPYAVRLTAGNWHASLPPALQQAHSLFSPPNSDSPRGSAASEDEDGWLSQLQRYILGQGEAEGEGDEFAPSHAPLAGRLRLRLTWQPVEAEPLPEPLFDPSSAAQQGQQPSRQPGGSDGQDRAAAGHGRPGAAAQAESHPLGTPPVSARPSLQLPREGGGCGSTAEALKPGLGTVPHSAAGSPEGPPTRQGSMLAAAVAAAAAAAAAAAVPQPGVLAVRIAHTKLEYGTGGCERCTGRNTGCRTFAPAAGAASTTAATALCSAAQHTISGDLVFACVAACWGGGD